LSNIFGGKISDKPHNWRKKFTKEKKQKEKINLRVVVHSNSTHDLSLSTNPRPRSHISQDRAWSSETSRTAEEVGRGIWQTAVGGTKPRAEVPFHKIGCKKIGDWKNVPNFHVFFSTCTKRSSPSNLSNIPPSVQIAEYICLDQPSRDTGFTTPLPRDFPLLKIFDLYARPPDHHTEAQNLPAVIS